MNTHESMGRPGHLSCLDCFENMEFDFYQFEIGIIQWIFLTGTSLLSSGFAGPAGYYDRSINSNPSVLAFGIWSDGPGNKFDPEIYFFKIVSKQDLIWHNIKSGIISDITQIIELILIVSIYITQTIYTAIFTVRSRLTDSQ